MGPKVKWGFPAALWLWCHGHVWHNRDWEQKTQYSPLLFFFFFGAVQSVKPQLMIKATSACLLLCQTTVPKSSQNI